MIRELMVNGAKNIPANYAAKVAMVTGMGVQLVKGEVVLPSAETSDDLYMVAHEFNPEGINKAGCDTSAFWDQYDSLEKAVHEQIDRSHKEWLVLGLCGKLNEIIKKPDPISDFVDFMENYLNDVKGNLKDFDVEKFSEVTSALLDNKQEISAVLAKDKKE